MFSWLFVAPLACHVFFEWPKSYNLNSSWKIFKRPTAMTAKIPTGMLQPTSMTQVITFLWTCGLFLYLGVPPKHFIKPKVCIFLFRNESVGFGPRGARVCR